MRRQILVVVALLSVGHDALGATLYPVIDLGTFLADATAPHTA